MTSILPADDRLPLFGEARSVLHRIEQERNVKVLFAVESGSRCWDFASADSDYDVRFIYARPVASYLGPSARRDVIENADLPSRNSLIDFAGWDIVKALDLASGSNPSLLEWLCSPIVYYEDGDFAGELRDIMREFSTRKLMHHYASMAHTQHKNYLAGSGEKVLFKKYLYALRPLFACLWLRANPYQVPPIRFTDLIRGVVHHESVRAIVPVVTELLRLKESGIEQAPEPRYAALDKFIEELVPVTREMAKEAPDVRQPDRMRLERLSVRTIRYYNEH